MSEPPKASVTEQAWAEYGEWIEEHQRRCPDCEHDAITMTSLYAEYHEGWRASRAAAIEALEEK